MLYNGLERREDMATRAKHAERSHYSYHTKALFYRFHKNAFDREQKKAQKRSLLESFNAFKEFIKRKKEEKDGLKSGVPTHSE